MPTITEQVKEHMRDQDMGSVPSRPTESGLHSSWYIIERLPEMRQSLSTRVDGVTSGTFIWTGKTSTSGG